MANLIPLIFLRKDEIGVIRKKAYAPLPDINIFSNFNLLKSYLKKKNFEIFPFFRILFVIAFEHVQHWKKLTSARTGSFPPSKDAHFVSQCLKL